MDSLVLSEGEGRSFLLTPLLVSWFLFWSWKAFIAYVVFGGVGWLWNRVSKLFGWNSEYYETYITLGTDGKDHHHHHGHGHHHHRHSHGHGHHHHHHQQHGWGGGGHGHQQQHGWGQMSHGWPITRDEKGDHEHEQDDYPSGLHKPHNSNWYHPATKLFKQPAIQYSPWGKKYEMYGFDQSQALKYQRKYKKKFAHYRRKYYKKKGKKIKKAERKKKKAERKKRKKERRKKKKDRRKAEWEARQKAKEWLKANRDKDTIFDPDDKEIVDDLLEDLEEQQEEIIDADEKDLDDLDEENDDEDDGDSKKEWRESSLDIEHGSAPSVHKYKPGVDYDPLPMDHKHQKFVRIRF